MKIPLGVVMGGRSAEHEISLRSGHQVLCNLDRNKYDVRAIVITLDNRYYYRDIGPDTVVGPDEISSLDALPPPAGRPCSKGPFRPWIPGTFGGPARWPSWPFTARPVKTGGSRGSLTH